MIVKDTTWVYEGLSQWHKTLKNKKKALKLTMITIKDLIYEADDLLTDCRIRETISERWPLLRFLAWEVIILLSDWQEVEGDQFANRADGE